MTKLNVRVANDIGNNSTKMIIDDVYQKQPSVVKRLLQTPNVSETNINKNVSNLFDELLVHITSRAIKRNGLYMIGNRANLKANQVENMNITLGGKYKHDIPVLMTLSMNAAYCIQRAFQESNGLPSELGAEIVMSTAIPASEYSSERAKKLEERFTQNTHIVVVYVGDKQVQVTLKYKKVKVLQEGVPALYALLESNKDILRKYVKTYEYSSNDQENIDFESYFEGYPIKPKDLLKDKRILHVDIGDGTTEYIYTIGVNPVPDACSGEKRGVGHATELARNLLKQELNGLIDLNRQQYMEAMQDKSHNLYEITNRIMEEARYTQAHQILEDVQEKFIANTSNGAQIIAVYGGGSIEFESELYPELLDFADDVKVKILWIPEEFAVNLNVNGMKILNDKVLYRKVKG